MARKKKELEVLSETTGQEIQEDFLPDEQPANIVNIMMFGTVQVIREQEVGVLIPNRGARLFPRHLFANLEPLTHGMEVQLSDGAYARSCPWEEWGDATVQDDQTDAAPGAQEDVTADESADPGADAEAQEDAATPDTFTFKADVLHVYKDTYELQVTKQDGGTATLVFDHDAISFTGQDVTDLQEGYQGVEFTVSWSLAEEKHLPEFIGSTPLPMPEKPAAPADDSSTPYNPKKLREETITVTVVLDPEEREACGQRMADAIRRKKDLEEQLDSYRKSINLQIKSIEKDIEEAADLWHEGQEERRIDCDVTADYDTCEEVWTEKNYPYKEVKRQPLREKDRHLPLPLGGGPVEQKGGSAEQDDAPVEQNAVEPPQTVTFEGEALDEYVDRVAFLIFADPDDEGSEDVDITVPREHIVDLVISDTETDSITITRAYALEAGIIAAPEEPKAEQERSCGTCMRAHSPDDQGLCAECVEIDTRPHWISGEPDADPEENDGFAQPVDADPQETAEV